MTMVIDCIDALKEATKGKLPIALTDTQSPFDTATLILDTSELFVNCYVEEETVHHIMGLITDLIIEFSQEQIKHIGDHILSKPGHIIASTPLFKGISISDENDGRNTC